MKQFFTSVSQEVVSPVYLFYGEQDLLKEEAVNALTKLVAPDGNNWNVEVFDGAKISVDDVFNAVTTAGFFSARRLIVVRDALWFSEKINDETTEALISYLENPIIGNILVFTVHGNIDKRRKIVKQINKVGRVIQFASLGHHELLMWVKRQFEHNGFKVSSAALDFLTVVAGDNLAYLRNEVGKICMYCAEQSQVELSDVEAVASRGSVLDIFKLIDAAADKKAELSLQLYQTMLNQGEAEQKILSMLGKQFRDILAVGELKNQGLTSQQIAKQLSIHPFVAKKCAEKSKRFTKEQLIKALELLLAADIANKSGRGDLRSDLQLAILRICI